MAVPLNVSGKSSITDNAVSYVPISNIGPSFSYGAPPAGFFDDSAAKSLVNSKIPLFLIAGAVIVATIFFLRR